MSAAHQEQNKKSKMKRNVKNASKCVTKICWLVVPQLLKGIFQGILYQFLDSCALLVHHTNFNLKKIQTEIIGTDNITPKNRLSNWYTKNGTEFLFAIGTKNLDPPCSSFTTLVQKTWDCFRAENILTVLLQLILLSGRKFANLQVHAVNDQ